MVAVVSKAFSDISYDERERILTVVFMDSSVFMYYDVPESKYEDFQAAKSMGAYFNKEIRPNYRAVQFRGQK